MVIKASSKPDIRCCNYSDCNSEQTCENCPPGRSAHKNVSSVNTGASPSTPRRRLMFVDKVFDGKKFYLDPKGLAVANVSILQLEADISTLGGTVEKFLSKEVTYVVTDKKEIQNAQSKSSAAKGTPFAAPFSRGQSLLAKSHANKIQYSNAILTAKQLGIRIIDIVSLNKIIREELKKCDPKAKWSQDQIDSASTNAENTYKTKHLKGDFIKHEDECGLFRPVYGKLSKRPCLNFDSSYGGCPFDTHKASRKPRTQSSDDIEQSNSRDMSVSKEKDSVSANQKSKRGSALKKAGKKRKEKCVKGGYCESCNLNYTDLKMHMVSRSHLDFIANIENFSVLDTCISSVPSLCEFENSTEKCVQGSSPKLDLKLTHNEQKRLSQPSQHVDIASGQLSTKHTAPRFAPHSVTNRDFGEKDADDINVSTNVAEKFSEGSDDGVRVQNQECDDTLVNEDSACSDENGDSDVLAIETDVKAVPKVDIKEVNTEKPPVSHGNLDKRMEKVQTARDGVYIQLEIKETFETTRQSGFVRSTSPKYQACPVMLTENKVETSKESRDQACRDIYEPERELGVGGGGVDAAKALSASERSDKRVDDHSPGYGELVESSGLPLNTNTPVIRTLPVKQSHVLPPKASHSAATKVFRIIPLKVSQSLPLKVSQGLPVFRTLPSAVSASLPPGIPCVPPEKYERANEDARTVTGSEKEADKQMVVYSDVSDTAAKYSDISSPEKSEPHVRLINSAMESLECDIARQNEPQNIHPETSQKEDTTWHNFHSNAAMNLPFDLSTRISQAADAPLEDSPSPSFHESAATGRIDKSSVSLVSAKQATELTEEPSVLGHISNVPAETSRVDEPADGAFPGQSDVIAGQELRTRSEESLFVGVERMACAPAISRNGGVNTAEPVGLFNVHNILGPQMDGPVLKARVNMPSEPMQEAPVAIPKQSLHAETSLLSQSNNQMGNTKAIESSAIPVAAIPVNTATDSQNTCDPNADMFIMQQNPLELLESLYNSAILSKVSQSQTVPNPAGLTVPDAPNDSQPQGTECTRSHVTGCKQTAFPLEPTAVLKEQSHSTSFDIDSLLGQPAPFDAINFNGANSSFDVANLLEFTERPSFGDDLLDLHRAGQNTLVENPASAQATEFGEVNSPGSKYASVEDQSESSCDDVMAYNRQAARQAALTFADNSDNDDTPPPPPSSLVTTGDRSAAASLTHEDSASGGSTSSDSLGNSLKSEHERLSTSGSGVRPTGFTRSSRESRSLLLNACRLSHKLRWSQSSIQGPDRSPSETSYCGESQPQAELCDVFNDNCVLSKPEVSGVSILQQMCENLSETSNHSASAPQAVEPSQRRLDFANVNFNADEIRSSITSNKCDNVESVLENSEATRESDYGVVYSDISGDSADPFLLRNGLEEVTSNSRLSFENILPFKTKQDMAVQSGVWNNVADQGSQNCGGADVPALSRGPYSDVSNDSVSSLDNTLVAFGSEISLSGSFHAANKSAQKLPKMCIAGDKHPGNNSGVVSYETTCSHKSLSSGYFSELQLSSLQSVADINRNVSKIPNDCDFKKPQSKKPKQARKRPKETRGDENGRLTKKRQREDFDDAIQPAAKKRPVRNAAVVAMVALNEINDKNNDRFATHQFDHNIPDTISPGIPASSMPDDDSQDRVFQTYLPPKQTDYTWKSSVVSDLKLKVSKIATTPGSSRDSWSVQKSGDCKMTLSAKRSKKYRKRTEGGQGDSATHSRKRKLVYD